jgi:hypothetical protein
MLPLTVKLRALDDAARTPLLDDASLFGGSEGFAVYGRDGRVGTVVGVVGGQVDQSPALAVRVGLFRHKLVRVAVSDIESVSARDERVTLDRDWRAESRA